MGKWGSSFFWNCWKYKDDSKNAIKKGENVSSFSDSCIWSGSGNFSLLLRDRDKLPVAVQMQLPGKLEAFSWIFIAFL